tara:strand:+ start:126 stop:368 length:243 start_codon:yes stop_codon:yes gene_type:complete
MTKETEQTKVTNLGEALSVLVQAVNIAHAKGGVYNFGDAAKINSALEFVDGMAKASQEAQQAKGPEGAVVTEEVDATAEK